MQTRFVNRSTGLKHSFFLWLTVLLILMPFNTSFAQESKQKKEREALLPPPPYVTGEGTCVSVIVKWDEEVVKKLLPAPFKPAPDLSGSVFICTWNRGYPFSSVQYGIIDIALADMNGVYTSYPVIRAFGPDPVTTHTFQTYYSPKIQLGEAKITETKSGYRAVASMNGKEFLAIEIKLTGGACEPSPALLNNLDFDESTNTIELAQFPVSPDICVAEPVSVKVTADSDDETLSLLQPKELLFAVVGKDAIASWGNPIMLGWIPPAEEK